MILFLCLRELTDAQLKVFQETNEIEVLGHKLGPDDLRLIYTFDNTSKDTPNCYEAHSDNDVSVLHYKSSIVSTGSY